MTTDSDREKSGTPASVGRKRALLSSIIPVLPYIWSRERPDLQLRVVLALLLLLATKVVTLAVPVLFKVVTDALTGFEGPPAAGPQWLVWLLAAPAAIVVAYCIAR